MTEQPEVGMTEQPADAGAGSSPDRSAVHPHDQADDMSNAMEPEPGPDDEHGEPDDEGSTHGTRE